MKEIRSIDGLIDHSAVIQDFDSLLTTYNKDYKSVKNRAFNQLNAFNKKYPLAKTAYKELQAGFIKSGRSDGVFCTTENLRDLQCDTYYVFSNNDPKMVMTEYLESEQAKLLFSSFLNQFHSFSAWRNTLGVYKMDSDIYEQSISSPVPPDTPTEIFKKLPDWCVYLEAPTDKPMQMINNRVPVLVLGFWAYIDRMSIDGKYKFILNIVLDIMPSENTTPETVLPVCLIIEDGLTVADSIKNTYAAGAAVGYDPITQQKMMEQELSQMTMLLSLLLWLCAEEPDISNVKGEPVSGAELRSPKYGVNKKTGSFVPPSQPIVFNIGKRLGGEIRQFKTKNTEGDARLPARKRPHIRRGHWHGAWRGTGQDKQFFVYWQGAIFVNAN